MSKVEIDLNLIGIDSGSAPGMTMIYFLFFGYGKYLQIII